MMLIVAVVLGVLVSLKALWNMSVAYSLVLNPTKPDGTERAVSMMFEIEFVLLILGAIAARLSAAELPLRWWVAWLLALALVLFSYLHFILVGVGFNIVQRWRRRS